MKEKKQYYSIRSFLTYISHYKLRISLILVGYIIANVFISIVPIFIGKLVGVLATHPVNHHLAYLYVDILIICSVGHTIFWHGSEYIYMKVVLPLVYRYENIIFKQVIQKPYPYFVDKFTGKISSYVTGLSDEFINFITNIFYNYTSMLVRLVSISVILLSINWQTGIIFVVNLLLMLIVGKYTVRNNIKYEKRSTDIQATKNGKIIDSIANFVNVKSFGKESVEYKTVKIEQRKSIKAGQTSFFWSLAFWASMSIVVRFIIWPVTILFNVWLYLHNQISIAQLTIFLSSVLLFTDYIWGMVWTISQFNLKLAKVEESYQYLFGPINVIKLYYDENKSQDIVPSFKNSLKLNHLDFRYPDNDKKLVLDDIVLTLNKGDRVGVVGKSGSGKTTISKLLLGYYPVEESQILLDDEPVATKDLANLISYVPQDTSLFHRTIAENIAYAVDKKVSLEEIIESAKKAHADGFIDQVDKGYDAMVGERGVKLSAGQRQRIAIARAFLDDKPILILDEATSALDSESELLVQQALESLWEGKTVIAIAHRLSTLRHMDKIIVIEKGRIIEQGTHWELLEKKGKYSELWAHQSGGFLEED